MPALAAHSTERTAVCRRFQTGGPHEAGCQSLDLSVPTTFPINLAGFNGRSSDYRFFSDPSLCHEVAMKHDFFLACRICLVLPQLPRRPPVSAVEQKPTFTLHSQRKAGQTDKVVVLDGRRRRVQGARAAGARASEQRVEMSGVCRLDLPRKDHPSGDPATAARCADYKRPSRP